MRHKAGYPICVTQHIFLLVDLSRKWKYTSLETSIDDDIFGFVSYLLSIRDIYS